MVTYFEFLPIELNIIILSKVNNDLLYFSENLTFINFFNTVPEFNTPNNIISIYKLRYLKIYNIIEKVNEVNNIDLDLLLITVKEISIMPTYNRTDVFMILFLKVDGSSSKLLTLIGKCSIYENDKELYNTIIDDVILNNNLYQLFKELKSSYEPTTKDISILDKDISTDFLYILYKGKLNKSVYNMIYNNRSPYMYKSYSNAYHEDQIPYKYKYKKDYKHLLNISYIVKFIKYFKESTDLYKTWLYLKLIDFENINLNDFDILYQLVAVVQDINRKINNVNITCDKDYISKKFILKLKDVNPKMYLEFKNYVLSKNEQKVKYLIQYILI
jgi:hypothetical protein